MVISVLLAFPIDTDKAAVVDNIAAEDSDMAVLAADNVADSVIDIVAVEGSDIEVDIVAVEVGIAVDIEVEAGADIPVMIGIPKFFFEVNNYKRNCDHALSLSLFRYYP